MSIIKDLFSKKQKPEILVRDVTLQDIPFVLDLNETNVEVLSPMDDEKFLYFTGNSEMFHVVTVDGVPAAFLIALREGLPDYKSENYIWFSKQYESFLYVDRIVIAEEYRRLGLGQMLYEGVFRHAEETGVPVVTAEIDIVPALAGTDAELEDALRKAILAKPESHCFNDKGFEGAESRLMSQIGG